MLKQEELSFSPVLNIPVDKPVRILLVDDSHSDRMLFREILKEIDPALIFYSANDGVDAIMLLTEDGAELPDVIFLDVNMPRMNGIETLEAIKKYEHLKHIPVIMFSAGEIDSYQPKAKELGATYCLKKSIEMQQNIREIKVLIEKALVHSQNS
jgi:CheY-like chemotaxis protein